MLHDGTCTLHQHDTKVSYDETHPCHEDVQMCHLFVQRQDGIDVHSPNGMHNRKGTDVSLDKTDGWHQDSSLSRDRWLLDGTDVLRNVKDAHDEDGTGVLVDEKNVRHLEDT